MTHESHFPSMGSVAHVLVNGDPRLVEVATRRLHLLESRWSRFRPASELSQLNAMAGRPFIVSADTVRLLVAMRDAYELTAGTFQPTVIDAVEALGYDRPLWEIVPPEALPEVAPSRAFAAEIDERVRLVRLERGVRVDPGGIGKGLAADIVADELMAAGADGVLINVGGDLRVRGVPADDLADWMIDIEHPSDPRITLGSVQLRDGAIATSTSARRRWRAADGSPIHHLVDPRTSQPTTSAVRQATVVCGHAQWAEVFAKCAVIDGVLPAAANAAVLLVDQQNRVCLLGADAATFFALNAHEEVGP